MNPKILQNTKTDLELSQHYANYIPEFLIDGLIRKGGKNIIAAERGAGKTRLLLWIAYSIIYECDQVFEYKINSFADVLFINLELAEKDFKAFTDPIRYYFESILRLKKKHQLFITSF